MNNKVHLIIGGVFLFSGFIFFFFTTSILSNELLLMFIALGCIAMYLFSGGPRGKDNLGFLISGFLLLLLSLHHFFERVKFIKDEGFFWLTLSLVFWLLFFIHSSKTNTNKLWPIFPAGTFLIIGMSSFIPYPIWPVILVGIGLWFIVYR